MTLVATATLALAWACTGTVRVERDEPKEKPDSGDETVPEPGSGGSGGRSGQSGNGGAAQGGNGGAAQGGGVVTAAEEAACAAYLRARCESSVRCGDQSACDVDTWDCPSALFVAGTSRTVEGVTACASAVASQACNDDPPPCLTPGKLPKGAPCTSAAQCQSFYCISEAEPACGTCKEAAAEDGPCDDNTLCPYSQQCVGGRCQDWVAPTYTDLPVGENCSSERQRAEFVQCAEGLWCETTIGADGGYTEACADIPAVGEACRSWICEGTAVCVDGMCQAVPRLGEDCLLDFNGSPPRGYCEAGARCLDRKCVAKGRIGDPCEPRDQWGEQCENGRCECAGPDCTRYVCAERRYAGESCTEPNTVCHYGTRCESGVCVSGRLGKPHVDACVDPGRRL